MKKPNRKPFKADPDVIAELLDDIDLLASLSESSKTQTILLRASETIYQLSKQVWKD